MSGYDIALQVTDEVLGEGTYAEINKNNSNPGVRMAIQSRAKAMKSGQEHTDTKNPKEHDDSP